MIDRIVATVNGHVILLSDWEDSLRYEAFSSGRPLDRMTADDRKSALDHLIDQELLREQLHDSDVLHPSSEEVAAACGGDSQAVSRSRNRAGLADTSRPLPAQRGKSQEPGGGELDLMRLVDARLRPSVTVDSKSIESYYNQELLPQLRQSGGQNVPLADVTAKIKELLTQKKISQLLTAWLQDLRAGSADSRRGAGGRGRRP